MPAVRRVSARPRDRSPRHAPLDVAHLDRAQRLLDERFVGHLHFLVLPAVHAEKHVRRAFVLDSGAHHSISWISIAPSARSTSPSTSIVSSTPVQISIFPRITGCAGM